MGELYSADRIDGKSAASQWSQKLEDGSRASPSRVEDKQANESFGYRGVEYGLSSPAKVDGMVRSSSAGLRMSIRSSALSPSQSIVPKSGDDALDDVVDPEGTPDSYRHKSTVDLTTEDRQLTLPTSIYSPPVDFSPANPVSVDVQLHEFEKDFHDSTRKNNNYTSNAIT